MFTFITSNKNKWEEVCKILNFKIPFKDLEIKEVQSLDLMEVLKEKAKEAYKIIKCPVVVEDVSLILKGYNNFPGPLVKWVIKSSGAEGIIKLCKGSKKFDAVAICGVCAYDGKKFHYFEGKVQGKISKKIKGQNGFGWDPVFIPEGKRKTFAEMKTEEKNKISHRKKAWKKASKLFFSFKNPYLF